MMPSACASERPKRAEKFAARDVGAQAFRRRDRETQLGEREPRAVLGEQTHVIRRSVQQGRVLGGGELEDRPRERARGQEDRGAVSQVEQDRNHEVVRHRQQPEDALARPDAQPAVRRRETREDRRVTENHALAPARGARGKAQIRGAQGGEVALAVAFEGWNPGARDELEVLRPAVPLQHDPV